jgi:hypothetical protein
MVQRPVGCFPLQPGRRRGVAVPPAEQAVRAHQRDAEVSIAITEEMATAIALRRMVWNKAIMEMEQ